MIFSKMQGTGNDFIVLFSSGEGPSDSAALAKKMCDRHFGIGADGLVMILPSDSADFRMEIRNADGSRALMCGNATRCVAKYLFDRGYHAEPHLRLETAAGIKEISMEIVKDRVASVRVDLGVPRWKSRDIPVALDVDRVLGYPLVVDGRAFSVNCVSMGNPHCVVYADDLSDALVSVWGPKIENYPLFPNRINVEFVHLLARDEAEVRVWERGCGETLACGTGAAAVCAVSRAAGLADNALRCRMPGGTLLLELEDVPEGAAHVFKTGPAEFVFDGEFQP